MATYDAATEAAATRAVVTSIGAKADAAIARLTDAATKWNITALSAVSNLTLTTLVPAAGTKPAVLALTLPTLTPVDFTGITLPALPDAPGLDAAAAPIWLDSFWTNLKTMLTAFTTGITDADDVDSAVAKLSADTTKMQSALYAKEYERKTQMLRDLYSAAEANTGAAGFTYPNSMTTAMKMDAQQKYQFDLSQTSRDLITGIFEWAKSNYQFSIQQGVAAHNADAEFNLRYIDTALKVYTSTVGAILDKYKTELAAAVSKSESRLKEYVGQFNAELQKHQTQQEIRIKEAAFDVEVAKVNAGIAADEMKIELEDFKARVSSFLETAKVNLEDRDANVKNQITAAAAAATATAALAQAASTITVNTGGA